MKLHTKLTLVLLLGIMVVVSGVQIAQYLGVTSRFSRQSEQDLAVLREREQTSARNICDTIGQAVSSSLQRGEMDKFARLLDQQRNIKGLLEFSLINRDGQVTHSSQPASLKRQLPEDLHRRFATDLHEYTLTRDDRIEIYRPQLVTADCTRCHTTWNVGEQGGVTYFAFSTVELANAEKESRVALATAQGELSRNSLVAVAAVVAVLATSVFFLVRRLIGRPLNLFTPLLTQFESGHGDLTQRIDYQSKDEIGNLARLFNLFLGDLEKAVAKSQTTARSVGDGASAQAAAIEETSAAVSEITSTMKNNAERAQHVNELMGLANNGISKANVSMQSASSTMEDVAAATRQISSITRTINEIAAKTTLLAINAAVEAARAGQAGAGFAVVAGNVRELASQSAQAASGIGKIIEDATARIQRGTDLVKATHLTFGDVAAKSTSASQLMGEIALTSKEQARGMDQISKAVASIDKATQQNAGQSDELLHAMSAFQTSAEITAAPSRPARASSAASRGSPAPGQSPVMSSS